MATQMTSKAVAVKTEAQQAVLALHRMRQRLVKFRTMQINSLRGLLSKYGEVMGVGRTALDKAVAGVLERLAGRLPAILIDTLRERWKGLDDLDRQIGQIERRLREWMKDDQAAKAIAVIPRVGLLTATAAAATMGHAKAFKSGREFAAWLGLVPGQTGSGGKVELLGISKRGDTYLRTLLVHGARSIVYRVKAPGPWVEQMKKRHPLNVEREQAGPRAPYFNHSEVSASIWFGGVCQEIDPVSLRQTRRPERQGLRQQQRLESGTS
jgi:transposase